MPLENALRQFYSNAVPAVIFNEYRLAVSTVLFLIAVAFG